jgi:hypothetical protein
MLKISRNAKMKILIPGKFQKRIQEKKENSGKKEIIMGIKKY